MSDVDVDFQVRKHLHMHLKQWPHLDPVAEWKRIKVSVLAGRSWLWPEPARMQQMDLFEVVQ